MADGNNVPPPPPLPGAPPPAAAAAAAAAPPAAQAGLALPAAGPAMQGGIRNVKLMSFGNEPQEDWLVFKHHFNNVVRLNHYTDEQARLALAAAMKGKAALATMDLDPDEVDLDILTFLDRYEARFMPASASQIARVRFDAARQGQHEDVLEYHARLRALHNKAYPGALDEVQLIRKFTMGLRKREVRMQVLRQNPDNYSLALQAAQNETSVLQMVRVTELGAAPGVEPMEIGAMDGPSPSPAQGRNQGQKAGNCHFCGEPGHWKGECELLKKARRFLQPARGRGGFRGRGRGGGAPGRGGRGRGAGAARGALLAALEAIGGLDDLEEPEPAAEEAAGEGNGDEGEDF